MVMVLMLFRQLHNIILLFVTPLMSKTRDSHNNNTLAPQNRNSQVKQLKTIIEEYDAKLNQQINDAVSNILHQTTKNIETTLPELRTHSKTTWSKNVQTSNKASKYKYVDLSVFKHKAQRLMLSYSQIEENEQQKVRSYIKSKSQYNHEQRQTKKRSIGNQSYKKPKVAKREVQVLTKQMRWDPFYEKNVIKAKDLDSGVLNLLQRGRIGKDVDIITAFEKGRPMLNLQPAIFHHGEEKFNQEISSSHLPRQLIQYIKRSEKEQQSESWAITAPPNKTSDHPRKKPKETHPIQLSAMQDHIFIKVVHFVVVEDESYQLFKRQNISEWPGMKSMLHHICLFLRDFSHEIVYLQGHQVLGLSGLVRRPSKRQIISCIFNSKLSSSVPLGSIRNIVDSQKKITRAKKLIVALIRQYRLRKIYKEGQLRRNIELKVVRWARNTIIKLNAKKMIEKQRDDRIRNYQSLQQRFTQEYSEIMNKKHYEVHIANRHSFIPSKFREMQNTDIIRIFNLDNPNVNIIYICPFQLNADTISYYYKIMELQEIQNFKDRVTFLSVESQLFSDSLVLSKRLYYSSKSLRALIQKVKSIPSYFLISYPSAVDIELAVYLQIPIMSGNIHKIMTLQTRTETQKLFSAKTLKSLKIYPHTLSVVEIVHQMIQFCNSFPNSFRFIVKLNNHFQSSGIGLLGFPFNSIAEMYSLTSLVCQSKHTIDGFYRKLAKLGGIVQRYEQNLSQIAMIVKVYQDGKYQITGSFDKVSYGFCNVAYLFPQKSIPHKVLVSHSTEVLKKVVQYGHFGYVEITFYCDTKANVFLEKVQCYPTKITSSLFYFRFLSKGYFNTLGQFMTKITEEENEQGQDSITIVEPRQYCYIPFVLHFGLSDKQALSFFQLCRIGGVSFDLQNKYGATFILLGSLKSSLGIITTAKQRKLVLKLMLNSLDFIIKQNSHNISNEMLKEKQIRMNERSNINSMRQVLQSYL